MGHKIGICVWGVAIVFQYKYYTHRVVKKFDQWLQWLMLMYHVRLTCSINHHLVAHVIRTFNCDMNDLSNKIFRIWSRSSCICWQNICECAERMGGFQYMCSHKEWKLRLMYIRNNLFLKAIHAKLTSHSGVNDLISNLVMLQQMGSRYILLVCAHSMCVCFRGDRGENYVAV